MNTGISDQLPTEFTVVGRKLSKNHGYTTSVENTYLVAKFRILGDKTYRYQKYFAGVCSFPPECTAIPDVIVNNFQELFDMN
jgi:hypothetical protein